MSLSPAAPLRRFQPSGRTMVIAVPFVFLLVFFLLPFLAVVKISFAEMRLAVPPYTDLFAWTGDKLSLVFTAANYRLVLTDDLYFAAYLSSIEVALVTTLICLLIGYPAAYLIARAPESRRNLLMMAVILPFWTSYLIRVYAWIGLLKDQGLVNQVLMWTHLIDSPLRLHRTQIGLYLGMVYSYLPYMILPLYAFLVKMNRTLEEAATDLGAAPWQVFFTITLPLSMPGIVAGSLLVFIPSVGEYVIPELLGGADSLMIGRVMWDDFFNNIAWPTAAAATCIMVALLLVPMAWFQRIQNREQAK
jgi:putrescine transport system permease protein